MLRSHSLSQLALAFILATPAFAAPPAAGPANPTASPATIGRPDSEGFIRDWLLLGPIFYKPMWPAGEEETDRQAIPGESRLRPKDGDTAKSGDTDVSWKPVQAKEYGLDLGAHFELKGDGLKYKLVYAVTYVVSDTDVKAARLRIGSGDLIKVYWNGKPVIEHRGTRRLAKDQNAAQVDIKKGVNVLVAKVINDENEWNFAARLIASGSTPVPGLKISRTPDGKGDLAAPDAEGFIRDWIVTNPIPYKTRPYAKGQLSTKQIPDEEKLTPRPEQRTWANTGDLPWKIWNAKDYFIDFDAFQKTMRSYVPVARVEKHNDTLFRVLGYAATYVNAPAEMKDVSVKIGANDHGLLYINGKEVAKSDVAGALVKDKVSAKVTLRKGSNTLLFKVVNSGDAWSGCVRFVDKDGKPITDLEITTTPPLTEEERLARE